MELEQQEMQRQQRIESKKAQTASIHAMFEHAWFSRFTAAFNQWREATSMRQERAMKTALSFFVNRELARGWVGWRDAWLELVAAKEAMERSLKYMLNRNLSKGWLGWAAMVEERLAALDALRRGAQTFINRKLALGWRSWSDAHAERMAALIAMDVALSRFANRNLVRGWNQWKEHWREIVAAKEGMFRALGNMLHRELSKGLRTWLAMAIAREAYASQQECEPMANRSSGRLSRLKEASDEGSRKMELPSARWPR